MERGKGEKEKERRRVNEERRMERNERERERKKEIGRYSSYSFYFFSSSSSATFLLPRSFLVLLVERTIYRLPTNNIVQGIALRKTRALRPSARSFVR